MEKVTFGLGVAGLGMIVVFVGLLILIGFITVLGLASRPKKPKAAPVKQAAPDVVAAPPVQAAPVAEEALPYCNIVCITGSEMKEKLSGYLQVLSDADAASTGGALPGDDFYYGA